MDIDDDVFMNFLCSTDKDAVVVAVDADGGDVIMTQLQPTFYS